MADVAVAGGAIGDVAVRTGASDEAVCRTGVSVVTDVGGRRSQVGDSVFECHLDVVVKSDISGGEGAEAGDGVVHHQHGVGCQDQRVDVGAVAKPDGGGGAGGHAAIG